MATIAKCPRDGQLDSLAAWSAIPRSLPSHLLLCEIDDRTFHLSRCVGIIYDGSHEEVLTVRPVSKSQFVYRNFYGVGFPSRCCGS